MHISIADVEELFETKARINSNSDQGLSRVVTRGVTERGEWEVFTRSCTLRRRVVGNVSRGKRRERNEIKRVET